MVRVKKQGSVKWKTSDIGSYIAVEKREDMGGVCSNMLPFRNE